MNRFLSRVCSMILLLITGIGAMSASDYIANVYGRKITMLNGKWSVIVDPYDQGQRMKIFQDKKPTGKSDFYEYSFEGAQELQVPGDWNSQSPEFKFYEGTIWYKRQFTAHLSPSQCHYLYFCGVSQRCNVYLNGHHIFSHEGSFTPFQVPIDDDLKEGGNLLVVEVNNARRADAIPSLAFDWWNYGGITRDVMLVTLPKIFISDYFIQLDKHQPDRIHAKVEISKSQPGIHIDLAIPELQKKVRLTTDTAGKASADFRIKGLRRWSPKRPKLYQVTLASSTDTVKELIGFRNIEAKHTRILLNGQEIFLKGVSFHEENPLGPRRACTEDDAAMLLSHARETGANIVRLAHYQQNEYIVRLAEKMGIMIWQEIPVWQKIDFTNEETLAKASAMLRETIMRDKNRCADICWGIANETPNTRQRNQFLTKLLLAGKELDSTRLYTAAFDLARYDTLHHAMVMDDDFYEQLDMVGINKYMGWYTPWPTAPSHLKWQVAIDKPLYISEFGGEAKYGRHGDETVASSWSEEYQAKLYKDNIRMFDNIPNLCGVSPWVLFDFRSPFRFHPANQDGWNRKGLLSDKGEKKAAWHVIHDYFNQK